MFQIRQAQFDALQAREHAATPKQLMDELQVRGVPASRDAGTGDVVFSDRRGFQTRVSFAPTGLIREIRRPSGRTHRFSHDDHGRLATVEHPGGEMWRFSLDGKRRLEALETVGHARYQFRYDDQSRLCGITHPDQRIETFAHSASGEVVSHESRGGAVSRLDFFPTAAHRTDALGRTVSYRLDPWGLLDKVEFPDGSFEEYTFDSVTRQALIRQRSGGLLACKVDDQGQPVQLQWEDGSSLQLKQDDAGRLVAATNATDCVNFAFDDRGRLQQEVSNAGTIRQDCDEDGRLIRLITHHGDTIRYQYDEDGRLAVIEDWDGRRITFRHADSGLPSHVEFPSGVVESWSVDGSPTRVGSTLTAPSSRVLSRQVFEFNACDRACRVLDVWGPEVHQQSARGIEYDEDFRVLAENDLASGQRLAQFGYDAVGNMVSDHGVPVTFGAMDNPVDRGGNRVSYDDLGNVTSFVGLRGLVQLAFSDDGRLQSASVGGRDVQYAYDGLCRRIVKTDGLAVWKFGWSGFQLLWEQYQPHPSAQPIRRDYLYIPGSVVPIGFREEGRAYWIQSDFRGAVIAVHDDSGQLVWRGVYDSFGNVRIVVNKVRQPWRLSGQYFDEETALHYNVVRYYSPELKAYLSLDPQWEEVEGTKYSYCANDPWNRADPLGTLGALAIGVIAVGAGLISGAIAAYNADDEKLSAFGRGFVVGAGAVLVGIGVALALPHMGVAATAIGALAAIGAVEGVVASVLEDLVQGREICQECMVAAAALGALLGVVIPRVGGLLGRRAANAFGPRVKLVLDKLLKRKQNTPSPKSTAPRGTINAQKQAGHIPNTPQHINRVKQGKPTSTFHGERSGEIATQMANQRGTPVPGRPNVKEYDFGVGIGKGPNGGTQTRVRVHTSPKTGQIHGHPCGPEKF